MIVANVTAESNTASFGSGGLLLLKGSLGAVQVRKVQAKGCKAGASGGAVAVQATVQSLALSDLNLTKCEAKANGGAVSLMGNISNPVAIERLQATENMAR